jgi:hypothetical protein
LEQSESHQSLLFCRQRGHGYARLLCDFIAQKSVLFPAKNGNQDPLLDRSQRSLSGHPELLKNRLAFNISGCIEILGSTPEPLNPYSVKIPQIEHGSIATVFHQEDGFRDPIKFAE